MNFYKFALYKYYFDKGLHFTAIVKYLAALIGVADAVANQRMELVIILGISYVIICFLVGLWLYKSGYVAAEMEVSNQVNPFVKEMRKKIDLNNSFTG